MLKKLKELFIHSNDFINEDDLFFDIAKIEDYDFSTNIAMRVSKNPIEFAEEIISKISKNKIFEKIDVAKPGFINIKLKDEVLCSDIENIFEIKQENKKIILVDYSSPNIAKNMHIGHLRSTVIGDSITKLLKHFGHNVISDSHIGDWGTQFGKLIVGYKRWLNEEAYKENPIKELQRIYIKFHNQETNELLAEARETLVKLQNKEQPYVLMWKEFVNKSMREYKKMYDRLGISFDYQLGESFYNDMMQPLVDELMLSGIAKINAEAKVVYFDEKTKIPPAIIQKQDGGFLYVTSDIATAQYREKTFKINKAIYVTDSRQTNHFRQLFQICKDMKLQQELVYVPFGIMSLESGNLSTRGGNTIDLKELLDEGEKQAYNIINNKNPNLSKEEKIKISKVVSIGAIKYFDLSHQRTTNITFTWEKALSFSGNSAPYIQYAYTRIHSLLNKANIEIQPVNIRVTNIKEREIVKELYQYGKILRTSFDKLELHHIANYLFKLTSTFNSWYAEVNILQDEENINSRLYIAKQVQKTIKEGLSILGIDVLERM